MQQLQDQADSCGYTNYMADFVTYPPAGQLPYPNNATDHRVPAGCDIWDTIYNNALLINPAFDIYRVFDTVGFLLLLLLNFFLVFLG